MYADEEVWMVLGHSEREGATVAVVVGAMDAHAAKACYKKRYPNFTPISWPSLSDLLRTTTILERARDGQQEIDLCPVLFVSDQETVDDAADPPDATIPCPAHILKALGIIQALLRRHRLPDPFENNAERFECGAFHAVAQRWEPFEEPGYFKWRDVVVRWRKYLKYLNRETTINRTMTGDEVAEMIAECRSAIELETMEERA